MASVTTSSLLRCVLVLTVYWGQLVVLHAFGILSQQLLHAQQVLSGSRGSDDRITFFALQNAVRKQHRFRAGYDLEWVSDEDCTVIGSRTMVLMTTGFSFRIKFFIRMRNFTYWSHAFVQRRLYAERYLSSSPRNQ